MGGGGTSKPPPKGTSRKVKVTTTTTTTTTVEADVREDELAVDAVDKVEALRDHLRRRRPAAD